MIKLGNKIVGKESMPYIIAEIGVNHEGSLDLAKKLIDLAKEGGADAAKFQTYKASKLASKNSPSYWDLSKESTTSQHELFKKYDNFEIDDYIYLSDYCKSVEIDFVSTPFDFESAKFLNPLVPFFKIASADITNIPLLKKVAKNQKPILISTGASTLSEIEEAIQAIKRVNNVDIGLLHCILNYPTNDNEANLNMIKSLNKVFPTNVIGYSDHTLPNKNMTSLVTAFLMGANILEKHFTHDKSLPGNDHYHAMDKFDLQNFKIIIKQIKELMGNAEYKKPIESELIARKNARRSIVAAKSLKINDTISIDDLTFKRPGTGICPSNLDQVLGKKLMKNIEEDQLLCWSDII